MLMVKAGKAVDDFIELLLPHLEAGDLIIDGGNSHFPDTIRRTKYLESKGMLYVGTGVSGGEEGARFGPSMMPGGSVQAWPLVKEIFQAICAKTPDGEPCCDWMGEDGAGHYVKMVHNGVEYGLMQAYAEGFDVFDKSEYELDNAKIAHLWNQGSVVRSWLCELAARAFEADGNGLEAIEGYTADSGEGRWTIEEATAKDVPTPVITASLYERLSSRGNGEFAHRVLAALRNQFGGHAVKTAKPATGSGTQAKQSGKRR
jgi:6-phosphogluconate dehydrogenase